MIWHIFRVLFAVMLSSFVGWASLIALLTMKVMQSFERFEAQNFDDGVMYGWQLPPELFETLQSGEALFFGTAVSALILNAVIHTRSLILHVGITSGLTIIIAQGLSASVTGQNQAMLALAIAGFISGAVYWLIAGRFS